MKTLRYLAAAALAAGFMAAPANATTFVFKGDGNNVTPDNVANVNSTCASSGDLCTIDHAEGFEYSKDSVVVDVYTYAGVTTQDDANANNAARLIQDINPGDSGLGAWSEDDTSDDQTQFDSREAIRFVFDNYYTINDVEFNRGGDTNCSTPANEGDCGSFQLFVDGVDMGVIVLGSVVDMIPSLGFGKDFLLIALTEGNGFTIAQLTVSDVPVPAALPLLLSGLAGLGFASRRRKTA